MSEFIIEGGHKLSGEITPQGAKNEALQVLSAVLLTDQPVTISNLPDIRDTQRYKDILSLLGVKITKLNQPQMPTQTDENGNPATNGQGMMKAMNWLMPIMMGVFALFYSSAFCIYMVMNSLITVVFNLVYNAISKKQEAKEEDRRLAATFKK